MDASNEGRVRQLNYESIALSNPARRRLLANNRQRSTKFTHLAQYVQITDSGHVRVRPCMNGDIVTSIKNSNKLGGIIQDVDADHEESGTQVVRS